MKVLVLSATGCMATGLIRALKDDPDYQLFAFTRDPESDAARALKDAGLTILKGDYGNKDDLENAFSQGIDTVFFSIMSDRSGGTVDIEQAKNVIDAAVRHGVKQLIYGSSARIGTQENFDRVTAKLPKDSFWHTYWEHKWAIGDLVRRSGLAYTIIKPPIFVQNLVREGYVERIYPDLPTKYILKDAMEPDSPAWWADGSDVGTFAAAAIREPERYKNKEFAFGAEKLTINQVAEKLRKASGKDVKVYEWPAEEYEASKTHPFHSTRHAIADIGPDPDGGKPKEFEEVELTLIDEWLEKNKAGTWLAK
ncbi:hypothetical protein Dda_1201 [Drechslerella dactyloides]|uniref:NmrA-like domain-containing protein n=1 Tax=Drechslerella dactyloides TaxID=74499 RepID=A0AAD6NMS8_DREDA|nr:hypothetical protein Dda_1201 [Drechslerella dactyloides]